MMATKINDYVFSFEPKACYNNLSSVFLCSHPMIINTDYSTCLAIKTPNMALTKVEAYIGYRLIQTISFDPQQLSLCLPLGQISPIHQTYVTNMAGITRFIFYFIEPPQSLFWLEIKPSAL
jgi:hypothetical protein